MLGTIRFTLFNSFSASNSRSPFSLSSFSIFFLNLGFDFINIHCCSREHPGPLNSRTSSIDLCFSHFSSLFFAATVVNLVQSERIRFTSGRFTINILAPSVNPCLVPYAVSAATNNDHYYYYYCYHRNVAFIHITIIMEFKCGVIFQTNKREVLAREKERENKSRICYIFSPTTRSLARPPVQHQDRYIHFPLCIHKINVCLASNVGVHIVFI